MGMFYTGPVGTGPSDPPQKQQKKLAIGDLQDIIITHRKQQG